LVQVQKEERIPQMRDFCFMYNSKDFNDTLDIWIKAVEQTDFSKLCAKPTSISWSVGQVCSHLIEATRFYLKQAKLCLSSTKNATEEMTPFAKAMFLNNEFPEKPIKGPASHEDIPQPKSKEELLNSLLKLKKEFIRVANLASTSQVIGKTKHPGLHYFNAIEWLQFSEMHLRHHLRQKKRIEEYPSK